MASDYVLIPDAKLGGKYISDFLKDGEMLNTLS